MILINDFKINSSSGFKKSAKREKKSRFSVLKLPSVKLFSKSKNKSHPLVSKSNPETLSVARLKSGLFSSSKQTAKRRPMLTPNSHLHLRQNVKKESSIKMPNIFKYRRLWIFLACVTLAIGSFLAFYNLVFKTKIFKVREVVSINGEFDLEKIKQEYLDTNLFTLRVNSVSEFIYSNYENVDKVYIRKVLPEKLEVDVSFNNPKVIAFNEETFVIYNQDYKVIKTQDLETKLVFQDFEADILNGKEDLNLPKIKEQYKETLVTEEEKAAFDWESVSIDRKKELFFPIRDDIFLRYETFIIDSVAKIRETYPEVEVIFMYKTKIDNISNFDLGRLTFTEEVLAKFSELNIKFSTVRWNSRNTLTVALEGGKVFLFAETHIRDLDEQLKDLDAIYFRGIMNEYRVFDLRTSNFSLTR